MTHANSAVGLRPAPVLRHIGALGLGAALLALALSGAVSPARAQSCDASQVELTQAIVDSQTALDQIEVNLNQFGADLSAANQPNLDSDPVAAARDSIDDYISALTGFAAQVQPISQSCGPTFANDTQTLTGLIERFQSQRARADQLLGEHQALLNSGEPALSQQQRESIQVFLLNQGFYNSAIDGHLGAGTRASIRAWQASSGYPATGYLSGPQAQLILSSPAAAQAPVPVEVPGLPPAPQVGGTTQPAPTTPADAAAQQVCLDNTAQVRTAIERTRDYRQQVAVRIEELRNGLRVSRGANFDIEAAGRTAAEIESYLGQLDIFYDQANTAVGTCGDEFDNAFAALTQQVDELEAVSARADQVNADYQVLIASGEPAMSRAEMGEVQQGLTRLGHYRGAIDAVFGPGTRNAIRAYQAEMGYQQTGYLSPQQVAELRRAAVTPVAEAPQPAPAPAPAPEPAPEASTIEPATLAAQVQALLAQDLAARALLEPASEVAADDGQFGAWWWQLHDAYAAGNAQVVVDRRYALIGAAFMERSGDSPAMVDALVLVGDAYARLGLYADAEHSLQRAWEIWSQLGSDDRRMEAVLKERLAAVQLVQAAAAGPIDAALFDTLSRQLDEARVAAEAAVGSGDALTAAVVDRLADLSAAAGRLPADATVDQAFQARYRR